MASEIRLRGAAAAHYPPRTPSSANNNNNNSTGSSSSSSVVGEARSSSTTQRRRSRSRVLPGEDYYWNAGNNNNNNNNNTNNNNNIWTHKNNKYHNRNSQRNTNDRQQQQQQQSSSAGRMETYATPRSASSSVSLGAPPMMMYPLHLQYQNDASGIASYYHDDDNNNDNINNINHHDTLGGTTTPQPQQPSYDDLGKLRTGKLLRAAKTHLEDYHVAYRTPLHVADHQYRAYLLLQGGSSSSSSSSSRKQGTWWTRVCCLQTCIGFSVVAVLFLVFVGFLINAQPILMAGTLQTKLVQDSDGRMTKHYLLPAPGTVQPMARTAYRAAMAYFVCILACLAALHPGWIQSLLVRQRRRLYHDIPDHASTTSTTLPHIHNPNGDNGTTTTTTAHESVMPSWTLTIWNRCNYIIRQRLTDRGWYHPGHKLKKERKTG